MQTLELESCSDCSRALLDTGDELVCPSCGAVKEKVVQEVGFHPLSKASALGKEPLGSYMGTKGGTMKERFSRGISGSNSGYEYMKIVSDFAGKEGGVALDCAKLIERVGEKLALPRVVILEAASISRKVLGMARRGRRMSVAEISAYSLIAACKIEGATAVSVREAIEAFSQLGRAVKSSAIIQLTIESPVRTYARRPEEYVARVLAKLSLNQALARKLAVEEIPPPAFFNSLRKFALELILSGDREEMTGKRPCALAASAVYSAELVLSLREARKKVLTQRELAECGDTAEYTIREQCATIFMPGVERLSRLKLTPPPPCAR
ncbi:MAG: hypothetical protein KGI38_03040 [Thaumarchaeota archaeon]|nr:hypothetical protein [Nitrososphaerota archaeon]